MNLLASRLFGQLGFEGFAIGVWETLYLTLLSTVIAYVIGLPLGVLLVVTDKDGLKPIVWLNKIVGIVVNIFRSIPFIILIVALIPVSRKIVGTSIGNEAMIFMLIVAAVISTVTVLGYSAMAGTIAAGGLGAIAVTQARPSNAQDVIWLCVALIVIIVQIIQELGMFLAKRTDRRIPRRKWKKTEREQQQA